MPFTHFVIHGIYKTLFANLFGKECSKYLNVKNTFKCLKSLENSKFNIICKISKNLGQKILAKKRVKKRKYYILFDVF